MSFKKILFVPRGDSADQPGVRRLLEVADENGEIEIFSPIYDTHLEPYQASNNDAYASLRDRLVQGKLEQAGQLAENLTSRGMKCSGMAAWDYPMSDAIVRRALKIDADLVITEPVEGRVGALSQGDWRLISRCPVSILLLKSDGAASYSSIVAAVDPFHAHGKPAELDEIIIETAKMLQRATHARLQVLHCFVPLAYLAPGVDAVRLPLDDAEDALEAYRRDALEDLVTGADLDSSAASLVKGKPDEILKSMTECGEADLLVMGGLSRGRIRDFVLGNTAERLVHDSRADLLILKPGDFATTVADHMAEPLRVSPVYYPF